MRRPTEFYLALGTLLFVAGIAALAIAEPFAPKQPAPEARFPVKVVDRDGRIRVDWNPLIPAVRSSDSATLEVIDGGLYHRYPVEKSILDNGGLDYVRRTADVTLTLTTYTGGRPSAQAIVRTVDAIQPDAAGQTQVRTRTGR